MERRSFLSNAASLAMLGGLAAGYGAFGLIIGRFLYASGGGRARWMFVTDLARMKLGDSLAYRTPVGDSVLVTRCDQGEDASAFIALSSTCPHLGCQVHWEAHKNRFLCPCHNGVFDPSGKAVSGPPAEAGQSLPRYPLKVSSGCLFIEAPTERTS